MVSTLCTLLKSGIYSAASRPSRMLSNSLNFFSSWPLPVESPFSIRRSWALCAKDLMTDANFGLHLQKSPRLDGNNICYRTTAMKFKYWLRVLEHTVHGWFVFEGLKVRFVQYSLNYQKQSPVTKSLLII